MEKQERSMRSGVQENKTTAPILAASKKRELQVVRKNPTSNMYKIVYDGGGEVPDELKGDWTSPTFATNAIRGYNKG
jgi:hypothetical protein